MEHWRSTRHHHRAMFGLGVVWLAIIVLATPSDEVRASLDADQVNKLVRELESREAVTRDAAEQALRGLGPDVLSLLPAIDDRTSGELKQRLLRIRAHLESLQFTKSAEATLVTLEGKMSLSAAFAALAEQTGNTVVDYRSRFNQSSDNTEVELKLVDVPFWPALDQLLDQAGLTLNSYVGESRKLAVVAASEDALPRYERGIYAGLFRMEATSLTAEKPLRSSAAGTLRMGMEIVWEPRVVPVLIQYDLDNLEIVLEGGDRLALGQTGTRQLPVQPGLANVEFALPLQLPSREAQEIASVKGQLTALVPGGTVSFSFKNLTKAKHAQQRRGGLTVVLDQVRRNGGVQQISVRLRLDQASESLQSHLDWVENNVAKLIDKEGKLADEPGFEKYLERPNEIGYSYLFPMDEELDGYTFIYETPAGIAEIPVDFELQHIPLP